MIYVELITLTTSIVYIVDCSGFTDSWRNGLAKLLRIKNLRPLPPFDCSTCLAFWACLLYAVAVGALDVYTFGFACLCSWLAYPLGVSLNTLRDKIMRVL